MRIVVGAVAADLGFDFLGSVPRKTAAHH